VNVAARLQAVARGGQIVVSEQVSEELDALLPGAEHRTVDLRGHEGPVQVLVHQPWTAPSDAVG
jgi:class 3 adenylate cyclase